MTICKNKLSSFPLFSGCADNNIVIPILYNDGTQYRNYNLTFQDLLCGIPFSAETSIESFVLSGDTLILNQINGIDFSVDLSSLRFTGNTSATCISDLYVHNLGGCSPINVLTDINSISNISAITYYGDGTNLTGLVYITGGTLSGSTLILVDNTGSEQLIDVSSLSDTIIESTSFLNYISGATAEAVSYTNSATTYVTVGGIEAGTIFSGVSMQDMWTDLLYPNLTPAFSTFNISGYSTTVDVGYTIPSGDTIFTWTMANSSFTVPNTIRITDTTNAITLATGLSNDGIETISIPYNIKKTAQGSNYWYIYTTRNTGAIISKYFAVGWYWRKYWGTSTDPLLDAVGITGLTNNQLTTTHAGTYTYPIDYSYKYFVVPTLAGAPSYIRDASTNLNIALAGAADGYTLTINGLSCRIVSVTNVYGYSTNCYVYRTKNQLGSSITFQID